MQYFNVTVRSTCRNHCASKLYFLRYYTYSVSCEIFGRSTSNCLNMQSVFYEHKSIHQNTLQTALEFAPTFTLDVRKVLFFSFIMLENFEDISLGRAIY